MYARSRVSCRELLRMIERRTGNGTEKDRLPLREVQRESTLKKVNWQRARVLGYHEQRESERRCLLREEGMERELQSVCSCGKLDKVSQMLTKSRRRGRTRRSGEIASSLARERRRGRTWLHRSSVFPLAPGQCHHDSQSNKRAVDFSARGRTSMMTINKWPSRQMMIMIIKMRVTNSRYPTESPNFKRGKWY